MKWNELFSLRISELVVKQLQQDSAIEFKTEGETIRKSIVQIIQNNLEQEKALDAEVYKMMEDLERKGHQFERHKMYPALKQQLAKKKGMVL